jgi:hypothetical protein
MQLLQKMPAGTTATLPLQALVTHQQQLFMMMMMMMPLHSWQQHINCSRWHCSVLCAMHSFPGSRTLRGTA